MITDTKIKKIAKQERAKPQVISDHDGLYIRFTPKGKVVFFVRYRFNKKAQSLDIGEYPLTTLSDARKLKDEVKKNAVNGINPKFNRRYKGDGNLIKFNDAIMSWYEKSYVGRVKNPEAALRQYEMYAKSDIGSMPVKDVTTHVIFNLIGSIKERTPSTASKLISFFKVFFKFAYKVRIVESNPMANISAYADFNIESSIDDRVLVDSDLAKVLRATCSDSNIYRGYGLAIRLLLFFGCRPSELLNAEISHFDFYNGVWVVPPENHKTGAKTKKPIVRPIIKEVEPIIRELISLSTSSKYLITSSRGREDINRGAIWVNWTSTINNQVKRLGFEPVDDWSIYTLRKTMRTKIGNHTDYHIAEELLGHSASMVQRAYDKNNYLDKKTEAYKRYFEELNQLSKSEGFCFSG